MKVEVVQKILDKNKQDYQQIAEQFSATRAYLWPELKKFGQYVKDGETILDLGCGNGRLYELFKDRPVRYVGIDNCQKLIDKAKSRYEMRHESQFVLGDALELPFEKDVFDTVFSIALFHHLPSEELRLQVLGQAKRVLKPGGTLIITCWNLFQINFWPRLFKYTLSKIFRKKIKELQASPHPENWVKGYKLQASDLDFGDIFIPWKLPARSSSSEKNLSGKQGRLLRYYHAFTSAGLRRLVEKYDFEIIDQFYSEKGRRVNWWTGYNIVLVAQKK